MSLHIQQGVVYVEFFLNFQCFKSSELSISKFVLTVETKGLGCNSPFPHSVGSLLCKLPYCYLCVTCISVSLSINQYFFHYILVKAITLGDLFLSTVSQKPLKCSDQTLFTTTVVMNYQNLVE